MPTAVGRRIDRGEARRKFDRPRGRYEAPSLRVDLARLPRPGLRARAMPQSGTLATGRLGLSPWSHDPAKQLVPWGCEPASAVLDELSGAGEPVESFRRRRGIRRSTLYWWRWKPGRSRRSATTGAAIRLLPVTVSPTNGVEPAAAHERAAEQVQSDA